MCGTYFREALCLEGLHSHNRFRKGTAALGNTSCNLSPNILLTLWDKLLTTLPSVTSRSNTKKNVAALYQSLRKVELGLLQRKCCETCSFLSLLHKATVCTNKLQETLPSVFLCHRWLAIYPVDSIIQSSFIQGLPAERQWLRSHQGNGLWFWLVAWPLSDVTVFHPYVLE